MIGFIVTIGLIAALWIGITLSARRFEARRRREGKWTDAGPIDPSFADPDPTLRAAGIHLPRIEGQVRGSAQSTPDLRPPSEEL